jgi:hypothetical protein
MRLASVPHRMNRRVPQRSSAMGLRRMAVHHKQGELSRYMKG